MRSILGVPRGDSQRGGAQLRFSGEVGKTLWSAGHPAKWGAF